MTIPVRSASLAVDGASLYYEVRGSGPSLLMIAGGGGDAGYYSAVADRLASDYTVVTYDRRGNSRSRLDNPSADLVMTEQSDDARALIDHLNLAPALIFGNSGGAVIGLDLAARYPERVAALVAHEPPIIHLLPDGAELLAFFEDVYATNQQQGWVAAFQKFAGSLGIEEGSLPMPADLQSRLGGNFAYLFAHELLPFLAFRPDLARLRRQSPRIVLAGGRKSHPYYYYRAGAILAERVGVPLIEFPGQHNGYLDYPREFAETLRDALQQVRIVAHV